MSKNKSLINWELILGALLILVGAAFLADLFLPEISVMAVGWPIIVILFGVIFLVAMFSAGRKGAGLAIPGVLITSLGLLLLLQNTFNLWLTWTYAWALLISVVGCGLLLMNFYFKQPGLRKAAVVIIGVGLILFVIFGIFFEIILDIGGENNTSVVFLSGGLVVLGLFISFSRILFTGVAKPQQIGYENVVDMPPVDGEDIAAENQTTLSETEGVIDENSPEHEVINTDTGSSSIQ